MRVLKTATAFLALHVGFIGISILAFAFIVNRPPPPGVDPATWKQAYEIGMAWTGPMYIVTGFLAALWGLSAGAGRRAALVIAVVTVIVSLGIELLGTSTGFPFGPYGYGDQLGPKAFGLVPLVIPLSWFLMLYASLGVATRVASRPWSVIVVAAVGLVAWDVLMDPTFSAVFPFWAWHEGGVYYGMPVQNWFGWFLTGLVLATIGSAVMGQSRSALARSRLPLVIYAANGIFPLALGLMDGLYWAASVGGAAMVAFLCSPWLLSRHRPVAGVAVSGM